MKRPLVSVVMPVYNGGDYFPLAVESVLRQTCDDFEIVIVNDGSADDGKTEAFSRRIAAQLGERVQYIQKANGGVASALNAGVEAMRGRFFCWLSHDDLFEPQKLERQIAYHQLIGKADAMLISDYTLIGPDAEVIAEVQFDHERFMRSPQLPLYRGAINGCTVFIPRDNLSARPFDERHRYTQDYWLWFELLKKYDFFHQPEMLVRYRLHPHQDSRKPESVAEGEALWQAMVEDLTEVRRVQLYGSSWRFYDETYKILEPAYPAIAGVLAARRERAIEDALVSVVIPFFNEPDLALRAAHSVLAQTHSNVEVILVDDGSNEDIAAVESLAGSESRVRLVSQANAGPAAARNNGLAHSSGDYIAFLDADDIFMPTKVHVQLAAMMREGAVFSHTSYSVHYPGRFSEFGMIPSGGVTGHVYPELLAGCGIATPTVMIHRSLVAEGFRFQTEYHLGEDILAWLSIVVRHPILGINSPLTVVEWSDTSAAVSLNKGLKGIEAVADHLRRHPVHAMHAEHIDRLQAQVAEIRRLQEQHGDINRAAIEYAFGQGRA